MILLSIYLLVISTFICYFDFLQINIHSPKAGQHCLRVTTFTKKNLVEIINYCFADFSLHHVTDFNESSYNFQQLTEEKVTATELYQWSASLDLVEEYQYYLNQIISSANKWTTNRTFYNCTRPRFGPFCQYSYEYLSDITFTSFNQLIHSYYEENPYEPTELTCYVHLQCQAIGCLDWGEICDGKIDCIDKNGIDEENCWMIPFTVCGDDESQCIQGSCISKVFFDDASQESECIDGSDNKLNSYTAPVDCHTTGPNFECEETICSFSFLYQMLFYHKRCYANRYELISKKLFSIKPENMNERCWSTIRCLINCPLYIDMYCFQVCFSSAALDIINEYCHEDLMIVPVQPVLFGRVSFGYSKEQFLNWKFSDGPEFICYDDQFFNRFESLPSIPLTNNVTCKRSEDLRIFFPHASIAGWLDDHLINGYFSLQRFDNLANNYELYCNQSGVYQCQNSSKCISKFHLLNRISNCFYGDDEDIEAIKKTVFVDNDPNFYFCESIKIYIPTRRLNDGTCDCTYPRTQVCEDEYSDRGFALSHISFQTTCNGFIELNDYSVNGRIMNDETDCEHWVCDNIYTHCDGVQNCLDGSDEVDCEYLKKFPSCPLDYRVCVSPTTLNFTCIHHTQMNDDRIDCLGATDEVRLCRHADGNVGTDRFYCTSGLSKNCLSELSLCDEYYDCDNHDDEKFCSNEQTDFLGHICYSTDPNKTALVVQFLCNKFLHRDKNYIVHFTLDDRRSITTKQIEPSFPLSKLKQRKASPLSSDLCHRGLILKLISNETNDGMDYVCFCPPSYYGNRCQYQSQRVSLTLKFNSLSDSWTTVFAVIAYLLDDTDSKTIHSFEQFSYMPARDCQTKFNIYLTYSTQPKDSSTNYSIKIDLYDKFTLNYRFSWFYPIEFPFLPVHRLAYQLNIPRIQNENQQIQLSSECQCLHGKCHHSLSRHTTFIFCRCHRGWSGPSCSVPIDCQCSPDSLCVGTDINHRSICICPIHKIGDRCFIDDHTCDGLNSSSPCQNGGQCIPSNNYFHSDTEFICVCQKGFTGKYCEIREHEIIVQFDKHMALPESLLFHFISYRPLQRHDNISAYKLIPINQDFVRIFWSESFHIVFIELFENDYYLIHVNKSSSSNQTSIHKTIMKNDRCLHVSEIFNQTIAQADLIYRIKFYHIPCRENSSTISCFYDEVHFCLCAKNMANCFEFDHHSKFDCLGQNGCENGALCFQDNPRCPKTSTCVCPTCFYGTRCQFSMNTFVLSLDAILGYHIRPRDSINNQSKLIHVSIILTVLMTIIGFVSGFFSWLTFKNKRTREVGCGFYLFTSSCTTILTMSLFSLKFWIFLMAQIGTITNRSFLLWQCISLDFTLRVCLNLDQWLSACVAGERALTTLQGARFEKAKSRRNSKIVIAFLVVTMFLTTIHDPIHRQLVDDNYNDDNRIWCIASYSKWLRQYDSVTNIIHFGAPFLINILSALIVIWKNAAHRQNTQGKQGFNYLLVEQFRQHKHLLLTPLFVVILELPRLTISIVSGCMKSSRDAWLYLAGYFISFVCPMSTFMLFVLPSNMYKNEFRDSIRHLWSRFETYFAYFVFLKFFRT